MIRAFEDMVSEVEKHIPYDMWGKVHPSPYFATHPHTCPFKVRVPFGIGKYLYVPCGHCLYCQEHKASDWFFRQMSEASVSDCVFFVTLTYNEFFKEPISKYTLQCLFKRLRFAGLKFRYIALAEYGPRTNRPHYHILMFVRDRYYETAESFKRFLENYWYQGFVNVKIPTKNHHKYIAKYSKTLFVDTPSWKLYSRRPGIGMETDYARMALDSYLENGERVVHTTDGDFWLPDIYVRKWKDEHCWRTYYPGWKYDPPDEYDISAYLFDLKTAYDKFRARKL